MSEPFGYTDKQWSEVARELPMGADHGKVRRLLERLGDGGLIWEASNPKLARDMYRRLVRDVSAAAQKLQAALNELDERNLVYGRVGGPTIWGGMIGWKATRKFFSSA